jgi:CRISPR/Cas system-associated endonuclease Cas1
LDPYKGVIHGDSRNAPALALDLEDVYRPLMVTSTVVTLFTKRVLDPNDFVFKGSKADITRDGVTKVVRLFGNNLRRQVKREGEGVAKSYLEHIYYDARSIAKWVDSASSNNDYSSNTTTAPFTPEFLAVK